MWARSGVIANPDATDWMDATLRVRVRVCKQENKRQTNDLLVAITDWS